MDETKLAWRVGIVVICAAVVLAILVLLLGEGWQSQYTIFVDTPTAPNVTRNTPVRKNGILIGRVAEVQNQDRNVRLTLKIQSGEAVYENEVCKIGTASFLGDAVIDFVPGVEQNRGQPMSDRSIFARTAVDRNPVELIDVALNLEKQVKDTLDSFKAASDTVSEAGASVTKLTNTIQEAVGNENSDFKQFMNNTKTLSAKAETAIDNFNTLMVNVNEFAGDPEMRQSLRESFRRLPEVMDELNTMVKDTRETINGFRKVGSSAEENLANLTEFTRALGEDGPEVLDNLNKSLAKVDVLMTDISSLTKGLGSNNGTLSKLINDPELYNNLNDSVRNIKNVTVQLEPLMNDVRFAVDGIARDPGQLGLRGSLDRSQPFSGFKGNPPGNNLTEPVKNGW